MKTWSDKENRQNPKPTHNTIWCALLMGLHLSSHMYKTNMYKKSFASIYKEFFFSFFFSLINIIVNWVKAKEKKRIIIIMIIILCALHALSLGGHEKVCEKAFGPTLNNWEITCFP